VTPWLFAISDAPVSFGRFARLFRDELHCRDAVFLDGAGRGAVQGDVNERRG
jgi:uncharacterized protein YigE (DUF2233 family)